jgi:signal transduction histidine kinase
MVVTMMISVITLLFVAIESIAYDYYQTRRELETQANTIAEIVADGVQAAVSFGDTEAASDMLKSLRTEPNIAGACIYQGERPLAFYPESFKCAPNVGGVRTGTRQGYVFVLTPVVFNGKTIGNVFVQSSLDPLMSRLRLDLVNLFIVFLLAIVLAFVLSTAFERMVSRPILALAGTAKKVSQEKDYGIRASKVSDDEMGILVDAINQMLGVIEQQNRQREQSLSREKELRTQAEENNRLKDEFLATLSHELRTPLTSIVGWISLIRSDRTPDDKRSIGLAAIERNARTQARLIEDLLDVSRIMTGKFSVSRSDVDINQVVQSALEETAPVGQAKQIAVRFLPSPVPVPVQGDAGRLQQAVSNILTNAIKFTEVRGHVEVRVDVKTDKASISVTDNGIGITGDFLPYIFERFRQADGSVTRRHGGLGLGLAIVRHIVELHGGIVSASSEGPNQGSTFVVELPLATASKTPPVSAPSPKDEYRKLG